MDPTAILLTAGKTLGDLAAKLSSSKNEHLQQMAELAKGQVDLIRMPLEFLTRENECLKSKLADEPQLR